MNFVLFDFDLTL